MARVSTFDAREALLRELKAQHAIVRDKPARLAAIAKQIEIAEKANFPQGAVIPPFLTGAKSGARQQAQASWTG
jgi:hypothetical protein